VDTDAGVEFVVVIVVGGRGRNGRCDSIQFTTASFSTTNELDSRMFRDRLSSSIPLSVDPSLSGTMVPLSQEDSGPSPSRLPASSSSATVTAAAAELLL